jgi:hypothetical protein
LGRGFGEEVGVPGGHGWWCGWCGVAVCPPSFGCESCVAGWVVCRSNGLVSLVYGIISYVSGRFLSWKVRRGVSAWANLCTARSAPSEEGVAWRDSIGCEMNYFAQRDRSLLRLLKSWLVKKGARLAKCRSVRGLRLRFEGGGQGGSYERVGDVERVGWFHSCLS